MSINKKLLSPIIAILGLVAVLLITLFAVKLNQNLNKKASTPLGNSAFNLIPGTAQFDPGTVQKVNLMANVPNTNVDGFQVVASISGVIPNDLSFQVSSVPGLVSQYTLTKDSRNQETLRLVYYTSNPLTPFNQNSVLLGAFKFTTPPSGSFQIEFDKVLSKIVQNKTSQDVLIEPATSNYSVTPCTEKDPSISISPTSQASKAGGILKYNFTVTNNSTGPCASNKYAISPILPSTNWKVSIANAGLTLKPGQSFTSSVSVTSPAGASGASLFGISINGINSVSIKAFADYLVIACNTTRSKTTQCGQAQNCPGGGTLGANCGGLDIYGKQKRLCTYLKSTTTCTTPAPLPIPTPAPITVSSPTPSAIPTATPTAFPVGN